jgi:hypothetical protein
MAVGGERRRIRDGDGDGDKDGVEWSKVEWRGSCIK